MCSENKGADQLRGVTAIFVFAYADCWFSHEAAQILFCLCFSFTTNVNKVSDLTEKKHT